MFSRSITRQYFRKADAVIVVYDITNETSFLNAKHWILSAHDAINPSKNHGNNDGIVFLLLGNKLDLADDDVLRYRKTFFYCERDFERNSIIYQLFVTCWVYCLTKMIYFDLQNQTFFSFCQLLCLS